ncbi:MAG: hypothetical protein R6U08_09910 [Bacillota bacterium]
MKNSKRFRLSLIIVTFFMILAAGSSIGDDEAEPEKVFEPAVATEEEPTAFIKESNSAVEEPVITSEEMGILDDEISEGLDIEGIEQEYCGLLQESFADDAAVEFDKAEITYYITPSDSAFMDVVMDALEGEDSAVKDWESFTEAMIELSEFTKEVLPGYWLEVRNPLNPELSVLILKDGAIAYDVVKDEDSYQ